MCPSPRQEGIYEEGADLQLWTVDRGECSTSRPSPFTAGKQTQYPLNERLVGPVWTLWRREKSLCPCRDSIPRSCNLWSTNYKQYAIQASEIIEGQCRS